MQMDACQHDCWSNILYFPWFPNPSNPIYFSVYVHWKNIRVSIINYWSFFLVRLGCLAERSDKTNIIHVNIGNIVTFCVPISKHLNNMFHMWHCKNINISISNIISIYICCVPRSAPWNIPRFSPIYPHLLHQTAVLMGTPLPGSAAASAGEQVNILR